MENVATCRFFIATGLALAKKFYVATEIFYVVTRFHRMVLRQSVLCPDPFSQGRETLCHDRIVLGRDRVSQAKSFLSRHNVFMSRKKVAKWRGHVL